MQLASIQYEGKNRVGVLQADRSLKLTDLASMRELIGTDPRAIRFSGPAVPLQNIHNWLPPVPDPGKILGVAMNNSASNERKISAPGHPAFFLKPPSCLVGHQCAIKVRPYYGSVHPEPELGIVIGKTARDIEADEAMEVVFGYTIFNDITGNGMRADDLFHYWAVYADDENPDRLERREQHLSYAARYKGTDTFGCMGPWLTTADEITEPDDLNVYCSVGGELIAEDSTRFYNFKVAELISYISQFQTLHPGDVISCGTAFKASPGRRSIHHANLQTVAGPVEVRIDGLGTLSNPVVVEEKPIGNWRLTTGESTNEDRDT